MKVFNRFPHDSKGIGRTARMMELYAPSNVTFVNKDSEAILEIIHVYGRHDHVARIVQSARVSDRKFAIVQHSILSTRNPRPSQWNDIWTDAELIWSAYDLKKICQQNGSELTVPFYYAPYGGDSEIFVAPLIYPRHYVLGTNGIAMDHESMAECYHAALSVGRPQFHLGSAMKPIYGKVDVASGISDVELANKWGSCEFVAALRHIEGFELPAVEGLLCGARPILYDLPCYRKWYEPWAVFIPDSDSFADRSRCLIRVLQSGPKPISLEERQAAAEFFNWKRIITGFWEMLS